MAASTASTTSFVITPSSIRYGLHAKDGKRGTPLKLTTDEQRDLVVFLESLSTFNNGWRPDDGGPCR
jgi:hypothetical protein